MNQSPTFSNPENQPNAATAALEAAGGAAGPRDDTAVRTIGEGPYSPARRFMQDPEHWIDRCTNWVADLCSPILVKESRQSLKSRQFQWTFMLLLLAVVGWSYFGVAVSMRSGDSEPGSWLMCGYAWILGFPLGVVIPLAAYRSLSQEYEDETIQLVSITTMSARRIVLGKLGSSMLQMLVYLSAVVPCLVFSYILRGIDFNQVFQSIAVAITGCVGLTCLALAMAGFSKNIFLRVSLNLLLMIILLVLYSLWCIYNVLVQELPTGMDLVAGASSLFFLTTSYLMFESATSLISFQAENRSTRIRFALVLQVAIAWCAVVAIVQSSGYETIFESMPWISICLTHYLVCIGAMTLSERPGLSNRVRRELPSTRIGRIGRGLLLPGPGRGFMFAILLLFCWNLMFAITSLNANFFQGVGGPIQLTNWNAIAVYAINTWFGCGYLSVTYLFMLTLGRFADGARILVGLLWVTIFHALTCVITYFVYELSLTFNSEMTAIMHFHWYSSVEDSLNTPVGMNTVSDPQIYEMILLVGLPSAILTIGCLLHASRELVTPKLVTPKRVTEADAKRMPFGEFANQ